MQPSHPSVPSDLVSASPSFPKDKSVEECLKIDQMLTLIDSILPFEACLYYQVIPLSVEASHLNLGMVHPHDTGAADYVRRQVSYINLSIVPWPIASDWHREMLSRYLSYAAKARKDAGQVAKEQFNQETTAAQSQSDLATYVVDSPDELHEETVKRISAQPSAATDQPSAADAKPGPAEKSPPPAEPAPPLQIELPTSTSQPPLSELGGLSPKALMAELLKRVMAEGIGRLFFERHTESGRVLWSKDGVVQAALENISVDRFQSLINEFKRLTHLSLLQTAQPRQAEIERWHEHQRVLIRFRVMSGTHGEEATLQVLRGAALKFYQQQQINQIGHDALNIAHKLQKRINEIRERSRQALRIEPMSANTLTAISGLLKDIDGQLEQLIHQQQDDQHDDQLETPDAHDADDEPEYSDHERE